MTKFYIIRVD